ncbi:MAG: bifunctional nuclease family protein [Flavobacteriales bacterium]|nr:bifunctional nuclease family protein [Flavobacteriales bacterium]
MSLIKLSIKGISYSQTQTGAYALILSEEFGDRKLPIIIAKAEAQSIAIALEENIKPPRPLTHDLFKDFADKFSIQIKEVIIHKLVDGVFHSSLVCVRGEEEVLLDSRTSDAVAIAIRFNAPIYTYKIIIDQAGVKLNLEKKESEVNLDEDIDTGEEILSDIGEEDSSDKNNYSKFSIEELQQLLDLAIKEENYERAAHVRDEMDKRA